jgi:hypothetical protein
LGALTFLAKKNFKYDTNTKEIHTKSKLTASLVAKETLE